MLKIVTQSPEILDRPEWRVDDRYPDPHSVTLDDAVALGFREIPHVFKRAGLGDVRRRRATTEHAEIAGRVLVQSTGWRFRLGKRLLKLASEDGHIWPHPDYCLAPARHPTDEEIVVAPVVADWDVDLIQGDGRPAMWILSGYISDPEGCYETDHVWYRILRIADDRQYVCVEGLGWCWLWGARFQERDDDE